MTGVPPGERSEEERPPEKPWPGLCRHGRDPEECLICGPLLLDEERQQLIDEGERMASDVFLDNREWHLWQLRAILYLLKGQHDG